MRSTFSTIFNQKFIRIFQKIRPYLFGKTSACFFHLVLPNENFSRMFFQKDTGENPKTTRPIPVKIHYNFTGNICGHIPKRC